MALSVGWCALDLSPPALSACLPAPLPGKSQDRLSSLGPRLLLQSLWALARLDTPMSSKWLNQWATSVQVGAGWQWQ